MKLSLDTINNRTPLLQINEETGDSECVSILNIYSFSRKLAQDNSSLQSSPFNVDKQHIDKNDAEISQLEDSSDSSDSSDIAQAEPEDTLMEVEDEVIKNACIYFLQCSNPELFIELYDKFPIEQVSPMLIDSMENLDEPTAFSEDINEIIYDASTLETQSLENARKRNAQLLQNFSTDITAEAVEPEDIQEQIITQ